MTDQEIRDRFCDLGFTDLVNMIMDAEKALDYIREQYSIDSNIRPSGMTGQAIRQSYKMHPYVNGKFVEWNGE